MRRVLAAIVIFAGWACIPLGAMSGLVASRFLGLNLLEGESAPQSVYGFSAAVVLLVFVFAAILTSVPLARAMFAVSPSWSVNATAAVMAVVGIVLIPDQLGRSFAFPILAGAAAIAFGGRLLLPEAGTNVVGAAVSGDAERPGQTPTWIFDTVELAGDVARDSSAASATPASAAPAAPAALAAPGFEPEPPPFSQPTTPSRRKTTRKAASKIATEKTCEWCSAAVPAGAETCPNCQAPLNLPDIETMAIPGVTEVSPELRAYAAQARTGKKRTSILKVMFSDTPVPQTIDAPPPSDAAALRPPSRELRAEMARLDAEIADSRPESGGVDAWDAATEPSEAGPEASLHGSADQTAASPDQRT